MKGTPGNKVDQQAIEDQILAHLGENDIVTLSGAQAQFDIRLEQLPPETLDLANILTQIEKPVQNAQFDNAQKIFKQDSVGVSFDADEAQKTFDAMDWGEKRSLPLTHHPAHGYRGRPLRSALSGYAGLLYDEHRRDGQPRGKY